jgi:hypothetical protein
MTKNFIIPLVATLLFIYLFKLYLILDNAEYLLYIIAFQLFIVNVICYLYKYIIIGNVALVLLSSILSVAIIESSLRLIDGSTALEKHAYFGKNSDYPFSKSKVSYYQTSWLGVQAKPGKYRAHKIHPNTTTIYDVIYHIGPDRFRVTPAIDYENGGNIKVIYTQTYLEHLLSQVKQGHVEGIIRFDKSVKPKRINMFGGSFVFGEGVNSNETIPYYFSKLNKDYNVKNYGSHMFGVHEALAILESDMDTKGDINFLLTAPWHAHRLECERGQSAANKPTYILDNDLIVMRKGTCKNFEYPPAPPLPSRFDSMVHNMFIVKKLDFDGQYGSWAQHYFRYKGLQESSIDLYIAIINKIYKISETRGQEFVLGFMKADKKYFYSLYNNDLIISKLKNLGISVVDMTLAKQSDNVPNKYVIDQKFERHASAIAHYERASILTKYLQINKTSN